MFPLRFRFLGNPAESAAILAPLGHDVMLILLALQLLCLLLLLLHWLWQTFCAWRKRVAYAASLVPGVEHVNLPPPGPVLMWAVQWDLDMRAMIDDLKNEGPQAIERYFQNEAFVTKLRKIVRNVVSQSEMVRITQEVRMRRELQKLQFGYQKSAEEEDEDARALREMMLEMNGEEKPQPEVAPPPPQPAAAFEGDDAAAWEAMLAVMNRKPFEEAPAVVTPTPATEMPATAFEGDDAAAWDAMKSVMSRTPFEVETQPEVVAAPEPPQPASVFEGDDAAAWEAMLAVMNRKPFEEATPAPAPVPVPATTETPPAAFQGDDAAAWEAMKSVMSRTPFEETCQEPEQDASDCSTEPVAKSESDRSEESVWAVLEELDQHGASLVQQAQKFVSLCTPETPLKIEEPREGHFFIGDVDEEEELLDAFWAELDVNLSRGGAIEPHVRKLLDCFDKVSASSPSEVVAQQFYIGDED